MEKVLLKIPRPLRLVANKYAFTLPRELVKHAGLKLNKVYIVVILDAEKEEEQQQQ